MGRMLAVCCLLFWIGESQGQERIPSPSEAILLAHADLRSFPPEARSYYRYLLRSPHITDKQWTEFVALLRGHVNQLSRSSDIYSLQTTVDGFLLRVNLVDLEWEKVFDKLADPYFTRPLEAEVVKYWPGGLWPGDGKYYSANSFQYKDKQKIPQAFAPWVSKNPLAKQALADVFLWTQSYAVVVRSDWFFNQSAIQEGRPIGYYDFLGIQNEKDFQDLAGYDAKKKRRRVEVREAVSFSGVAQQARAIVRESAEDGGLWATFDFRVAVGAVNPLRVLGRDIERAFKDSDPKDVATEQYCFLPNGFLATYLGNNKGERQNVAPDFVGRDKLSTSNDGRIHINMSCVRCHVTGGFLAIDGWFANSYQPPAELRDEDYHLARLLRQQYVRDLDGYLKKDRLAYEMVLKKTTGMDSKTYAKAYGFWFDFYENRKVDLAWASRDLGISAKEFQDKLLLYAKITGKLDPALAPFIQKRPGVLPIKTWEEILPLAYSTIESIK